MNRRLRLAVRIMQLLFATFLVLILAVSAWNYLGAVRMPDVDGVMTGTIRVGTYEGFGIAPAGVALIRDWVERKTRPEWDVYRILWHQLRYNAVTEGYELYVWMEHDPYDTSKEAYAIYVRGDVVFLRIEPYRRNRVLIADFDAKALETALEDHLVKPN